MHSSEHNPERDIPGTQTAPQPDNDPSGIAERLLRLAQQFEDQHAPQQMTLLLREAAAASTSAARVTPNSQKGGNG